MTKVQTQKEPEGDEMQILVDFYNLDLKSGRVIVKSHQLSIDEFWEFSETKADLMFDPGFSVGVITDKIFPDETERQRIKNFFKTYNPKTVKPSTVKPSAEAVRKQQGNTLGVIESLDWYERKNQRNWFESKDYLDFVDHWQKLRRLLDSILDRQLDVNLFAWFRESALHWREPRPEGQPDKKGYLLSAILIDPDGNYVEPLALASKTVPLGKWKVEESNTISTFRFGVNIGYMLYAIHRFFIHAMKDPTIFGRCKAEATPRRPACQNVFLRTKQRGKPRTWCSETCKKRIYEAEKREKRKQQYEMDDKD